MNNSTKSKQNAQSEMHDYDFKTKIKCTTMQTDAARWIWSSHEVILPNHR